MSRTDLAARIDRLQSAAEIRSLAHLYAVYLDSRDVDALAGLFVEDVWVTPTTKGREAMREALSTKVIREVGLTILHVGNHVIDFDGPDDARGVVYCRAEVQTDAETLISQAIHYGDTYSRRRGRWYFVRRKHELFYGVEIGRRPVDLPPANWPEHHTGKGTVPERFESWQRFWERTSSDQPRL